jgi:hypothetical protein
VHRQLIEWLGMLGLRSRTPEEDFAVEVPDTVSALEAGEPIRGIDEASARLSRSRDG